MRVQTTFIQVHCNINKTPCLYEDGSQSQFASAEVLRKKFQRSTQCVCPSCVKSTNCPASEDNGRSKNTFYGIKPVAMMSDIWVAHW